MSRTVIHTEAAPQAIGPYSQGIMAEGRYVFVSGQIPLDRESGEIIDGGIESQVKQVMENLAAILEEAGSGLQHVVKTTILLHNIDDFGTVNDIYGTYFTEDPPARATFGGLQLPKGVLVEIDCIAVVPK